jgi:O-antigen/teichoic acid export membrane protein
LWSVANEGISKVIFLISNVYLARILGVSSFGLFTLAQATTIYLWLAVDLGSSMYGIREIAKRKENAVEIINPLLTLRITAGFIVFSLYMLSLLVFDVPTNKKLAFAGCGLYLLTYAFYSEWILKGIEKFKYIAFGNLLSSVVYLSGIIYFINMSGDVIKASFIWSLSYLVGGAVLLYVLYAKLNVRYKPNFDISTWISHIRESKYFAISGSLAMLNIYLPIFLLSIFFTSYEVGLFSAPYRIVMSVCTASFIIPMAFYPVLSELYAKDKIMFKKTHAVLRRTMIVLGLIAGIIGTIWAHGIVLRMFGRQYIEGAWVFKILVWFVPVYFLRYSYVSAIVASGLQRLQMLSNFLATIAMLTIGTFIIARFDLKGAAISLFISELVGISLMHFIYKRKLLVSECNEQRAFKRLFIGR